MLHRVWTSVFVLLLAGALAAQSTPIHFVAGIPVVRAKLVAGEATYECHLVIDLARTEPLFLHSNAAQSLGALNCEVRCGELRFEGLPVTGQRDTWLEGFTRQNATALTEVPAAGYLGLGAFGDGTLTLDGPCGKLALASAASGFEKPPESETRAVLDLNGDPREVGLRVRVDAGDKQSSRMLVHTKEPISLVRASLAQKNSDDGLLASARAGALDFTALTPFHPEAPPSGADLSLGGSALSRLVTTAALQAGWIAFEPGVDAVYPADEAAYVRARFGDDPATGLAAFLADYPESTFRQEAAQHRLGILARSGTGGEELLEAALAAVEAAPETGRARAALEILEQAPHDAAFRPLRRQLAEQALEYATNDEDGTAGLQLRLELGRIARVERDFTEARRHLLAAVFGLRGNGPANLELGRLYEDQDDLERARSRYLLAMLDMKNTGEDGLLALQRVHEKLTGSKDGLIESVAELVDGRVPAMHPIPREPEEIQPTGKVALVELFTGAMCPPCAAADVAFDALDAYFGADEIALIQWHLPVPAPEPLVADASLARAQRFGVRGTPTAVFDGGERIVGGGRADAAPDMFAKYRDQLTALLAAEPVATLAGRATVEDGTVQLSLTVNGDGLADLDLHAVLVERTLVFPGSNGILMHHHVARAAFTPGGGARPKPAGENQDFSLRLGSVAFSLDQTVQGLERRGPFRIRPIQPDPGNLAVVAWLEREGKAVQAVTIDVEQAP